MISCSYRALVQHDVGAPMPMAGYVWGAGTEAPPRGMLQPVQSACGLRTADGARDHEMHVGGKGTSTQGIEEAQANFKRLS